MDEFVKKAFEDAIRETEKRESDKELVAEFETLGAELFPIFIKQVGTKRAMEFLNDVFDENKYGGELTIMMFIFFAAGYNLKRCQ